MNKDYTQLAVWIEGQKLIVLIDSFTKRNPKKELCDLSSQIRRAVTSVSLNRTEECGRPASDNALQYLHTAGGSLYKLEKQLDWSLGQNDISRADFDKVTSKILICKKLINGFINYYKKIDNEK
ncbi:hypothetical protein B0A69_17535 [Chryseobacterium shigense]|uniref:Four helix bundle protein n=1 Tax=Chryseobacterium shigense TaxID=297244 RepID=A0A1N7ID93_9FLAO|nr:four helix bundle protein [Chryseobacterium shigense]PQA91603.1 hypothetical protein B0A69_17535 [Chryseobacterium shigense]SIS35010.1 four helix bundle protein [Chryseobacterium shigense]